MVATNSSLWRIAANRHKGIVVARGLRKVYPGLEVAYHGWWSYPNYIIVRLDNGGAIHVGHDLGEPDSGSSVVVSEGVKVSHSILTGDHVTLQDRDGELAMWAPSQEEYRRIDDMDRRHPAYDWVEPGALWGDQYETGGRLCVIKCYAENVLAYDMDNCQVYVVDRRALAMRCEPLGESWGILTSVPSPSPV
jgi:hypothetical protein